MAKKRVGRYSNEFRRMCVERMKQCDDIGALAKELNIHRRYLYRWRDQLEHLRSNIEAFIDQYYNRCRLHSALGYQPPEEFEQQLESAVTSAGATMSFFRHGEAYRPDGNQANIRSGPQTAPLSTIGFDESPAGYSLASCSPAELASASPADTDSEPRARV